MSTMQFVTCGDESCPFNENKTCRAPFIAINELGLCMIREGGPFKDKSDVDKYVEIRECRCQKCNFWELDEALNIGRCGLGDPLFFNQTENSPLGPKCSTYEKQIGQPGFSAPNV